MTVRTAAGATLGASAAVPATFDKAGYAALALTLVGEITDLGEFGRVYNLVTHQPLASRATVKKKGSFNSGNCTLQVGLDNKDAGQTLLKAAVKSDNDYAFGITLQNGDIYYFSAQVMSFKIGVGSVDKIVAATISLEITAAANGADIIEALAA